MPDVQNARQPTDGEAQRRSMKPSLYEQVDAVQVSPAKLKESPRHWNPSLLRFKGRLFMAYRYHLPREHASRCAVAMVELNAKTLQPKGTSQHLNFPGGQGDEHYEDARLFMFRGEPHISYTQMRGYRPGVDYTCIIKYAQLKLVGDAWKVVQVYWPHYGQNHGHAKEKNWAFFEHDGNLHCVYSDQPTRRVLQFSGDRVVKEYETAGAVWPWGIVRGGAPPIADGDGQMLAIFHSSIPTEIAPHFVRYYGAAYTFEAKPPFALRDISETPLFAGSELDGHGYDPRYAEGWKPFVVFPCGCVEHKDALIISMGVNDWQCGIARMKRDQMPMVPADGTHRRERFFCISNASVPIRYVNDTGTVEWLRGSVSPAPRAGCFVVPGYFYTAHPREAEAIEGVPGVTEISSEDFQRAMRRRSA